MFGKLGSKQTVMLSEERSVRITLSDSGDITVEPNTDLLGQSKLIPRTAGAGA